MSTSKLDEGQPVVSLLRPAGTFAQKVTVRMRILCLIIALS